MRATRSKVSQSGITITSEVARQANTKTVTSSAHNKQNHFFCFDAKSLHFVWRQFFIRFILSIYVIGTMAVDLPSRQLK